MCKNVCIVYSMAAFNKTEYSQNASKRLLKHLQESPFLFNIKTDIDQHPADYKTIIQNNIAKIPKDGYVLTLAVLTEWNKAKTMDDLRKNESWQLLQKTSTPESSEKPITKSKTEQAHKRVEQAHKRVEQAHERVEQAHKRRSAATRKVTSKKSALEILRDQRKTHVPPKNAARYSHSVKVSATHKVDKHGYGGGNRRTAKKHRKHQKN